MSKSNDSDRHATAVCHGCDEEKDVTEVEMEYGGTELLCDDCIRQSAGVIADE